MKPTCLAAPAALLSVSIPEGVMEIGGFAFQYCHSLGRIDNLDGDGVADPALECRGRWWRVARDWTIEEIPAP